MMLFVWFFGFMCGAISPFIIGYLVMIFEERRKERLKEMRLEMTIKDTIKEHFNEGRDKSI